MTPCIFHWLVQNPISLKTLYYILLTDVTKIDLKITIPNELLLVSFYEQKIKLHYKSTNNSW